jgi:hypothetical protein
MRYSAYKLWYNRPESKNIDSISLISLYLLKNSYSILTQIGNVFMSDRSSLVASDGNNKVKVGQGFIEND